MIALALSRVLKMAARLRGPALAFARISTSADVAVRTIAFQVPSRRVARSQWRPGDPRADPRRDARSHSLSVAAHRRRESRARNAAKAIADSATTGAIGNGDIGVVARILERKRTASSAKAVAAPAETFERGICATRIRGQAILDRR